MDEMIEPMSAQIDQQQLAQQLVKSARSEGIELVGPDGMLTGPTKQVLEIALETTLSPVAALSDCDAATWAFVVWVW